MVLQDMPCQLILNVLYQGDHSIMSVVMAFFTFCPGKKQNQTRHSPGAGGDLVAMKGPQVFSFFS